jgi:type I restriction-modification system DNA methylase subunit
MSKTFDQGREEIAKLCRFFANNRQAFLAPGVKEAHVRQSLIDPFFETLGWDVRNATMIAPQYREVITEDSLDIEGQQKAPDYTFRVGTLAKFYVEAKKCGVNINTDLGPAYQLRRYGFSAKLALSILTDFEELGVYDCASRPRPNDKASHARIQYYGFAEYPDCWREIWDVFSREAVWSGTFDQYAVSKRKRGTSEVDSEFLKDIEGWRDVLARNLALRNGDLSADDLNAAVQKIIDRIIFLRMAEDRGLESYGQLHKLCDQPDIYNRFMSGLCQKADQKYNSGLFHFEKEPGVSEVPDSLTPDLSVDDNVLKPILQSLYFEHGCPYHFGVLPVEILGTVYERFLGKVIRLTAGHQAKVEEKPEVRKAGGVYYTPAYIVNYIVLNTIGKQVESKSPADLAGNKTKPPFRVLDMACGSGSFLLGAYQFLLDHCLKWYQTNPAKKHASAVYQNAKGETRLTIAERKRILTSHIFGVDIDRQAVETTKLSLLLKALEGENDSSLSKQMSLFHERALPNLSDNIKCGNSLIASDFSMLPEDLVRVHAFDWPAQFPDAMKSGGFDAIIGNPPYGADFDKEWEAYIRNRFRSITNSLDSFIMFVEQAGDLLSPQGHFGMIIPSGWVSTPSSKKLRERFAEQFLPTSFVSLPYDVFDGAYIDTIIVTAKRITSGKQWTDLKDTSVDLVVFPIRRKVDAQKDFDTFRKNGDFADWIESPDKEFLVLSSKEQATLVKKLRKNPATLNSVVEVMRGIETYNPRPAKECRMPKRAFNGEMLRYELDLGPEACEGYPPDIEAGKPIKFFKGQRILLRQLLSRKFRLQAVFSETEFLTNQSVQSLIPRNTFPDIKCILAILNSRLISWFFCQINMVARRDDFPKTIIKQTRELPFPKIDSNNSADKARHDKLVGLVDKMLALMPKLRGAKSESEKTAMQNAVTTTDIEIDRLVYELYSLTEEEIKIVEGER